MSSLSTFTNVVWCIKVFREDKLIDEIEYSDEELATEEAEFLVSKYVEATSIYHHAEIIKKVYPRYV